MAATDAAASEAELEQISAWNWHGSSYAPPAIEALIHEQIQQQVEHQPQAEAVCAWDGSLSYRELNRLSSLLARHLQETHRLEPETFVPLCFEKSKWNVVSMLAILKAGGACVPLDPKHPTQRMQTIIGLLGDRFAGVVLTCPSLMSQLAELEQPLLNVSQSLLDDIAYLEAEVIDKKSPALTPSTAALIIFTSGSTGTPKGIIQEHKMYCSAAAYHGPAMAYSSHSRVFQFAAHTFDVSLSDILTTLIHGGCICIPSEEERLNDVVGAICRLRANHLHLTPTVACMIDPKDVLPAVKVIVLGGEQLSRQVLDIWADNTNLIQGYGPAEAGVDCTVRQHVSNTDPPNNLGRPVGSSIWITNPKDHDQLVPIGVEGELLIEGPIVARGYLADETQTNRSFIWDPAWVQHSWVKSGRRFYKTGDLGFYGPDGAIHIVGRSDFQIKLRGQRIELGEVECQLSAAVGKSAKARVAVAAVTPKGGDGKVLAAFIVADLHDDVDEDKDDFGLTVTSVRELDDFRKTIKRVKRQLQQNLPAYMIPSVFLPLRKLPLSLSGKIERKLLMGLAEDLTKEELSRFTAGSVPAMHTEIMAPSTRGEEILCTHWKDVLQAKNDISVNDNFFDLGGDSAKAMLLVSSLRKSDLALTVADIFKHPVLRQQAPLLRKGIRNAEVVPFSLLSDSATYDSHIRTHAANVCGVHSSRVEDIYPITEMQERFFAGAYVGGNTDSTTWVIKSRDTHEHARRMVFNVPEAVDVERLLDAWRSTAQRHNILRTRFIQENDSDNSRILQVVVDEDIPLATFDCPLGDFVRQDQIDQMTWGNPLVRVSVGKDGTDTTWFVLTISHAIYDGFSLKKIFEEVTRAYNDHHASPSPVEPSVHMSHWIRQLKDGNSETAIDFWRNDFSGANVKHLIPSDKLNRKTIQNVAKRTTVNLVGVLPPGAANRATMIQVSAALVLAHRLVCGDVIFDCHLSGRTGTMPGVGDLVGPTLTSLPIRVRTGRDQSATVEGILRQTQQHMNRVVEYEHVGWWTLVQMDEFRDLLRGAPLLNVLPGGGCALGSELGLELQRTIAQNEVPHGMGATLVDANTVELLICGDNQCVSQQELEHQLEQWEMVLQLVWASCMEGGHDNLEVGDISALLSS
ncbi:hypothetical protein ACHAQA_001638 [Verticillium albo-atrum]